MKNTSFNSCKIIHTVSFINKTCSFITFYFIYYVSRPIDSRLNEGIFNFPWVSFTGTQNLSFQMKFILQTRNSGSDFRYQFM